MVSQEWLALAHFCIPGLDVELWKLVVSTVL